LSSILFWVRQGPRVMRDLVPMQISKDDLRRVLHINADTLSRVFDDFARLVVDSLNLGTWHISGSSSAAATYRI